MITTPNRRQAVELIKEAVTAGAIAQTACDVLEISLRTYKRWRQGDEVKADSRPNAERPEPANKLTPQERQQILAVCQRDIVKSGV